MNTKALELREKLKKRIESLPTETLKQACIRCMTDFQDGTGSVLEMSLDALQCRLSTVEFTAFCEELEG